MVSSFSTYIGIRPPIASSCWASAWRGCRIERCDTSKIFFFGYRIEIVSAVSSFSYRYRMHGEPLYMKNCCLADPPGKAKVVTDDGIEILLVSLLCILSWILCLGSSAARIWWPLLRYVFQYVRSVFCELLQNGLRVFDGLCCGAYSSTYVACCASFDKMVDYRH